jgi:Mitochondrial small ribosomal subunit Rsm22
MREHAILRKITELSGKKPDLMLSEVLPPGETEGEKGYRAALVENLKKGLLPLGLGMMPEGNDFRIFRIPQKKKFFLSRDDQKRLDSYFSSPGIPKDLQDLVQEFVSKKTGKAWNDPVVLERIRSAVVSQKGEYWKDGKRKNIQYEKGYRILAYLAYHFPVYFVQSGHILMMLAQSGLLREEMTIVDAGSGPGAFALAARDFFSRTGHGNAEIYAIESSGEQREAYSFLTGRFAEWMNGVNIRPPVPEDIRTISPSHLPEGIDLLIFQNVLNELTELTAAERAEKVAAIAFNLSTDGVIVIIEPADMVNSIALRETVRELGKGGLNLIAPCPPMGTKTCHTDRCWSFVEKPPVRPTRLMDAIATHPESYRFRNTDIKYSYAVLVRVTGPYPLKQAPCGKKTARLSSLSHHVGRRINICAALMSGDVGNSKTHLWKLCDGTPQKPVYAVMPSYHVSKDNAPILTAGYGEMMEIAGVLVRYNPRYDSYNLLVTRNTHVTLHSNTRQRKSS